MFGRRNIAAVVAEFLGTGILTVLILTVQRSTIGVPFFIAMAAGLVVALMVLTFNRVSGSHMNPALTLGLWTARKVSTIRAVLYIGAQMLGGWAAYYLYTYFVNNHLQKIGGHYSTRIMVAEAVGTAIFSFGFAAALYQRFTVAVTAASAGIAYMIGIIGASSAAIGLLNPAVALGARAWVWGTYVLGPLVGAVVGVNLYGLLFSDSAALGEIEAPVAGAKALSTSDLVDEEVVLPVLGRPAKAATTKPARKTTRTSAKPRSTKRAASVGRPKVTATRAPRRAK